MLLKKIVVAEDDDAIAHMVGMALGDAGFLCIRASNGEDALKLVRTHDPDLLILDVMMPRIDGIEVARRLKADVMLSRVPILMLTALSSVDSKIEGFEAGADDYLVKPFDLREFAVKVRAMIRAQQRERERNPTTGLPGSRAVESHLEEVLNKGGPSAVVHIDLHNFDHYADQIGFSRADDLARGLGDLVLSHCRELSAGSAFVGHLGGADFIAVVAGDHGETLAKSVVESFEAKRGDLIAEAPSERRRVKMAVAVVSTEGVESGSMLAERLASAMRQAKQRDGSSYVVWPAS